MRVVNFANNLRNGLKLLQFVGLVMGEYRNEFIQRGFFAKIFL